MVTGANQDDWHLRGVDVERDIAVGRWLDVRRVNPGEGCAECGAPLEVFKTIEVGHIFKLGTKYSEAMGARVLDEEGQERPIVMGSYGIGLGRQMAAVVEAHHDEAGIVWPVSVAPYEAVVTPVAADAATAAAAEAIYRELAGAGDRGSHRRSRRAARGQVRRRRAHRHPLPGDGGAAAPGRRQGRGGTAPGTGHARWPLPARRPPSWPPP